MLGFRENEPKVSRSSHIQQRLFGGLLLTSCARHVPPCSCSNTRIEPVFVANWLQECPQMRSQDVKWPQKWSPEPSEKQEKRKNPKKSLVVTDLWGKTFPHGPPRGPQNSCRMETNPSQSRFFFGIGSRTSFSGDFVPKIVPKIKENQERIRRKNPRGREVPVKLRC